MAWQQNTSKGNRGHREGAAEEETVGKIDAIVGDITTQLQTKNGARDRALVDSRQLVRRAANAIRALHRGEFDVADSNLAEGRALLAATKRELGAHPDIYWAGYVQDSQKEFAEAHLVAAMIRGLALPGPEELGVESAPYLNGMAEAASELRRYVLDIMRAGEPDDMAEAERALRLMDDVYTTLITVDYPDQITGGLRRTCDALRAVLERTRGDLTISMRQTELAQALTRATEAHL
jgi:translin